MKKRLNEVIGIGALAMSIAVAGVSFANTDGREVSNGTIRIQKQSEAEFPSMAKITMDEAVKNALATSKGDILKVELEDENGFLVYHVEVVTPDKGILEVAVDAGSGKVLTTEQDKPDKEHHESDEHEDQDHED